MASLARGDNRAKASMATYFDRRRAVRYEGESDRTGESYTGGRVDLSDGDSGSEAS